MSDGPNIVTVIVLFLGVALCFWRAPRADGWHVLRCLIAGALWCSLLIFDPSTRKPMFGVAVSAFLILGLGQNVQRRRVGPPVPR
jgi:hypothetical protein